VIDFRTLWVGWNGITHVLVFDDDYEWATIVLPVRDPATRLKLTNRQN
jgi:hypothetical protein